MWKILFPKWVDTGLYRNVLRLWFQKFINVCLGPLEGLESMIICPFWVKKSDDMSKKNNHFVSPIYQIILKITIGKILLPCQYTNALDLGKVLWNVRDLANSGHNYLYKTLCSNELFILKISSLDMGAGSVK